MALKEEPVPYIPKSTDTYIVFFSHGLEIEDFKQLREHISGRTHSTALDFGIYETSEGIQYIFGDSISHPHLNIAVIAHAAKQGQSANKIVNGHVYVNEDDKIDNIIFHNDLELKTNEYIQHLMLSINPALLAKNGVSIYTGDKQYMFFPDLPSEHALGEVYAGRRVS